MNINNQYSITITPSATLVTLIALTILLRLGFWQLQRADEKQQRLHDIAAKQMTHPIGLEASEWLQKEPDIPIEFTGKVGLDTAFLLDNRIFEGTVGYEVVTPIETSHGLLLANWGWIAGTGYRQQLPRIPFAELGIKADQTFAFRGVTWSPGKNIFVRETANYDSDWPKVIQQIDLDYMGELLGVKPLPILVALHLPNQDSFTNNHKPVVMRPEKHIAYAVQWFGLAAGCLLVFLCASLKKRKDASNPD